MSYTLFRFSALFEDLRSSWYFRIYTFLWVVCAVVSFTTLILFGQRATRETEDLTWRLFLREPSSLTFPDFRFRIGGSDTNTERFINMTCSHSGAFLPNSDLNHKCVVDGTEWDSTKCRAVKSSGVSVKNQDCKTTECRETARIECVIHTTIVDPKSENTLIAWELDGKHVYPYGPNSYAAVWLRPSENAWVLLKKAVAKKSNKDPVSLWERTLVYHSTISNPGVYRITTILSSFFGRTF